MPSERKNYTETSIKQKNEPLSMNLKPAFVSVKYSFGYGARKHI